MDIGAQIPFDAAIGVVSQMQIDPAYVEMKLSAIGPDDHDVEIIGSADSAFTVSARLSMPTDDIPSAFRSFLGSHVEARFVEAWEAPEEDGTRHGTISIDIVGAPMTFTGAITLESDEDPARTIKTYDTVLKANVPLIGGRIEQAAAPFVSKALNVEKKCGEAWLAEHRP